MPKDFSSRSSSVQQSEFSKQTVPWRTFPEIVQRLHQEGIYIHPDQLAEFLLRHGLPVDPEFVPQHLKHRAERINANYGGDMAKLETVEEQPRMFLWE